jgi:hypothetical protein
MRAIIALKSDADVRKERWQFQICDLVYVGGVGCTSHPATVRGSFAYTVSAVLHLLRRLLRRSMPAILPTAFGKSRTDRRFLPN